MKKLTNKKIWLFAIGQLGWSILSGIIINWLVYFYQPEQEYIDAGQTLFIPQGKAILGVVTVIGAVAAIGRVFDAFTDPLVASKSDRCASKNGRRIPFMKWISIPFSIITVLVFCAPINKVSNINSLWVLVTVLLYYLCLTIYCTPYNALIAELGRTQKERVNISTFISITYFIGTGLAYLAPTVWGIFTPSLGRVNAIRLTFIIMAAIASICMLVPVFTIKESDYIEIKPCESKAFTSLMKTFKNKEFRTFILSDVLYWIALTIFQTGLPFYVTKLMKLPESMNFVFFILMTMLSLVVYVPVNKYAKKLGKKKMVVFAFFCFTFMYLVTAVSGLFGINGMVYGYIVSIMAAIPMAILGILPQAIVADIAEYDSIETKEKREGMFYASRTFAFKLGQSVALLIFTGVSTIGELGFGYRLSAVLAALFCFFGGLVLTKYNEKKVFVVIGVNDENM